MSHAGTDSTYAGSSIDAPRRWAILALLASYLVVVTIVLHLRPHLRHEPSLRPVNPSLGCFGEALLSSYQALRPGARGCRKCGTELLASSFSTHAQGMAR
jgi:hypothetical protein